MKTIVMTKRGPIELRMEGVEGHPPIILLHGGHFNCNTVMPDEAYFLSFGYRLVIPSRPGYGQTPVSTGKTAEEFADALVCLMDEMKLEKVTLVATSASGRTALQFAGLYPERTEKLILQCALTHDDWPSFGERVMSYLLFNPYVEKYIWNMFSRRFEKNPHATLKQLMGSLTTLKFHELLSRTSEEHLGGMVSFLQASRSEHGFLHDLKHTSGDLSRVVAPTLIIRSRFDKSVDASHVSYARSHIPHAEYFESEAESHLIWFSQHYVDVQARIRDFLATASGR